MNNKLSQLYFELRSAKRRVWLKRRLRRAGVSVDPNASTRDLIRMSIRFAA